MCCVLASSTNRTLLVSLALYPRFAGRIHAALGFLCLDLDLRSTFPVVCEGNQGSYLKSSTLCSVRLPNAIMPLKARLLMSYDCYARDPFNTI